MLYALVCYNNEKVTTAWTKEEDDAVMARLGVVHQKLEREGRFGPAVRLMPTRTATTLRKDGDPPFLTDGPYAETKEQLLGFYVIDCEDMKQAQEVALDLARANPGGAYEIRPVMLYVPAASSADRRGLAMAVEFNHTLVHANDPLGSAQFLAQILGMPAPKRFRIFQCVQLDNGTTLDFIQAAGHFDRQHYAFLVSEAQFDEIFARIRERGLKYWADPHHQQPGEINHHFGGRGVYWDDPDGHILEIITRPYGSDGSS